MAWFVVWSQVFDGTQIFKDVFNIDFRIVIIHQFLINQWFLDIVLRYAEIWTVKCKKQILAEAIWMKNSDAVCYFQELWLEKFKNTINALCYKTFPVDEIDGI